jgi:excisionase family DNA binding protein
MQEDGAFTINQFCAWASIGRTRVYELINCGDLKAIKLGSKTLIPKADARAWLASLPAIIPAPSKQRGHEMEKKIDEAGRGRHPAPASEAVLADTLEHISKVDTRQADWLAARYAMPLVVAGKIAGFAFQSDGGKA